MRQSDLLNKLGLGASGVVLPTGLARVKNEPVRVYNGFLQSIMHYGYVDLKDKLREGDSLQLKRESENMYDTFAVGVFWKGVKLGYLPTTENIVIANLLDSGVAMTVYLSKIDMTANPQQALGVVVFTDVVVALPAVSSKFVRPQNTEPKFISKCLISLWQPFIHRGKP